MDEVFSLVDPVPLATASVAQVHAAVLRGSNKDVVIKVSFVCAHGERHQSGMIEDMVLHKGTCKFAMCSS